jgi:hypothetical protein
VVILSVVGTYVVILRVVGTRIQTIIIFCRDRFTV